MAQPSDQLLNLIPNDQLPKPENEQLAGLLPDLNIGGITFPSEYEFVKRFVKTSANISSGGGITSIDDPTYLGFSLLFEIDSPLFNGATTGDTELRNETQADGVAQTEESSIGISPSEESAVGYLKRIGEEGRATYLRAFIQGILKINRERPYYFQTIDGLKTAWEKNVSFEENPYVGSDEGEGITIGCLEALDLKMTALFNLYKLAVYDTKYKRTIVPHNLLEFNVQVIVHEIRKFKTLSSYLNKSDSSNVSSSDFVNGNTSAIKFKFKECRWDAAESGFLFDTVSNSESQIASTSIKFSYSDVLFDNSYSGYNTSLNEIKDQRKSTARDVIDKFAQNQKDNAVNEAKRRAQSFGNSLVLGNAFGIGNQVLNAIDNPQALTNALNGAALTAINGQQSVGNLPPVGGRILPPGRTPTNNDGTPPETIATKKILPPGRRPTNNDGTPPKTFSSSKIFRDRGSSNTFSSRSVFGSRPSGPPPLNSTNVFE